ncbi:hypothetical protein [Streptomyces sp. NPDC058371]
MTTGIPRALVVRGGRDGHQPAAISDFDVPEVRTSTERGLLWASR